MRLRSALFGIFALLASLAPPLRADDTKLATTLDGTTALSGRMRDLSPDGRFVLFASGSPDYVSGDTNGVIDLFLRDLVLGTVERINIATDGSQDGSGSVVDASVSADGRFVVFETAASLDPGDTTPRDVYLRDVVAGTTTFVSHSAPGGAGVDSYAPRISRDGARVVYVSGRPSPYGGMIFEWERATDVTTLVSTDSYGNPLREGSWDPRLSADGSVVAFDHAQKVYDAPWPHHVFVKDTASGLFEQVDLDSNGYGGDGNSDLADLSPDGRFVLFNGAGKFVADDTNHLSDGHVRDRSLSTTERVTLGTGFRQLSGNPILATAMSDDARHVAFTAIDAASSDDANGVVDAFVFDRDTGVALRASLGPDDSEAHDYTVWGGRLSADGLDALFETASTTLWPGDADDGYDVFLRVFSGIPAASDNYDVGFPGRYGVPGIALDAPPRRQTTLGLDIDNSSGLYTVAVLFVGLSSQSLQTSLGGKLLVDPFTSLSLALSPSGSTLPLTIPTAGDLPGVHIYLQALEVDPFAVKGVSFTPGLDMTIGD
jgi:Tol biopolymer transport system component